MSDKLVGIYNRWGEKEKLQPLESADAMLFDDRVNDNQKKWLNRFIGIWEKVQERGYKIWIKNKGERYDYKK